MTEQSRQQVVPVAEAVGMVLPHDITEIVKDRFKGRAFKKGHIIRAEDIDHLRRLGKEHIYVLELGEHDIHENEAALCLAEALAGGGTEFDREIVEGKADVMITDAVETRLQQKLHPELCAIHPDKPFDFSEKAYMMRRDYALKLFVDQWLHQMRETGGYARLYAKWIE